MGEEQVFVLFGHPMLIELSLRPFLSRAPHART
jgi:hypothetical protein